MWLIGLLALHSNATRIRVCLLCSSRSNHSILKYGAPLDSQVTSSMFRLIASTLLLTLLAANTAVSQEARGFSVRLRQKKSSARVTRDDLLISLHTSNSRLALIKASRAWRKGVRTVITSDQPLTKATAPPGLVESAAKYREHWEVFESIKNSDLQHGPRAGDLRAAMAPFIANMTVGIDTYKWILYGDDDTIFNIDNVLAVLNRLNSSNPYLLTDCLWFPEGVTGALKKHPNHEAPRCLPCEYQDPLLDAPGGAASCASARPGQFAAPRACECTPQVLCAADSGAIFNKSTCASAVVQFLSEGHPQYPHMGWWYMVHGGAGAILSAGLMRRATFDTMREFFSTHPPQSGDALISRGIWHKMGIGPTDPGYGYCRPHIQQFDPGWKGFRSLGPEDAGTADGGADILGALARMELFAAGTCNAVCDEQVLHLLSLHLRAKYAAADYLGGSIAEIEAQDLQPGFRVAAHLMRKIGRLFSNVADMRRRQLKAP